MNIDFPLHIGNDGRTVSSADDAKHVRDMIELVLFTNPGERVMRPDFGTGLLQRVFGPNSAELAATLKLSVQASLAQWLGDVMDLKSVDVVVIDAELEVTVVYVVRSTGDARSDTFVRSAT